MFVLATSFLLLIAALIVCWVDVPRVHRAVEGKMAGALAAGEDPWNETFELAAMAWGYRILATLLVLWPLFWLERLLSGWARARIGPISAGRRWRRRLTTLLVCACPPMRMAAPNESMDHRIWLPGVGWQHPGRSLSRTLERAFGTPMLVIALAILPILLIEYCFRGFVDTHPKLRVTLHVSTGLIWAAFAIEFTVRFNATKRKWRYIKENWIDLAIVVLPLVSFLRSFRLMRAAKVLKATQVQQLARLARVYRLRGLGAKAVRAMLLLDVTDRVLRTSPERRLAKLQQELEEQLEEIAELQERIAKIKRQIAQRSNKESDESENPSSDHSESTIASTAARTNASSLSGAPAESPGAP